MRRHSPFRLGNIIDRLAALTPARHRELVRAMSSEMDAIADPAERRRFAAGAIIAIVRLALFGYRGTTFHAPGDLADAPDAGDCANLGGSSMTQLTARQVLRRHVTPFAVTLAALTGLLLANTAWRRFPELSARDVPPGGMFETVLLSLPHILALTIPMAVLVAVSWVFTRLGGEGVLAAARRERHGFRRLVAPVLGAAALLGALTFVSNTLILPHTNARLATVVHGVRPEQTSDRTMTIGQLRDAAADARDGGGERGAMRAAAYEVEIHKKFAVSFACVVLALAGAAVPYRFPRRGAGLVIGGSVLVFAGYYISLVAGESLADRLVIPPFVAMWFANALLLAVVLLLVRQSGGSVPASGHESLAIGS